MYTILAAGYVASMPGKWIWFSWHPLAMIVSFILLASNAALIKKIGGYNNTKLHGYLMATAIALALFGWYVIYSNKEMSKKQHVTTLHAKLGVGVLLGYIGLGLFGAVALDPAWGVFKTNKTFRAIHKFAGRAMTAGAWVVCVLGEFLLQTIFLNCNNCVPSKRFRNDAEGAVEGRPVRTASARLRVLRSSLSLQSWLYRALIYVVMTP